MTLMINAQIVVHALLQIVINILNSTKIQLFYSKHDLF